MNCGKLNNPKLLWFFLIWLWICSYIAESVYFLLYDNFFSIKFKIMIHIMIWVLSLPILYYVEYITYKHYKDIKLPFIANWILKKTGNIIYVILFDCILLLLVFLLPLYP